MSYSTEQHALQQQVWNYCIGKGIPEKSTAGIMGNISQESSWDINAIENNDGSGGFGLFQETGTRRDQLVAYGTDMQHQLYFFWSELSAQNLAETGAEKQWYNASGYTYSAFMGGTYSASESASAFCWCWERPDASLANLPYRQSEAEFFLTTFTGSIGDNHSASIESAVQWLIDIANDDTHGYDQDNRWSPDYDCSSFVISGFEQAGIPLKTNGATYTGNMKDVCLSTGFVLVDWNNDVTKLIRGDIILNEVHHVCVYIGNGKIVQASINELGTVRGGQTGDQTGKEIYTRDYYVYSSGWDCVLRYPNGSPFPTDPTNPTDPNDPNDPRAGEVYGAIQHSSYNVNQLEAEQVTFLKTLRFNDSVKMKFTFNHNKRQVGQNFMGKKLTFDNKEYKIKDVRNDGYIILTYSGSLCFNYVNPRYIMKIT